MSQADSTKLARRALLPRWIRSFSWLLLLFLATPVFGPVALALAPDPARFSAFGFTFVGSPFAPDAILIQAILFVHGAAAYGLLWGKSWGVSAGLLTGALGLTAALATIVRNGFSEFQVEPLFQVPFLLVLFRLRDQWAAAGSRPPAA